MKRLIDETRDDLTRALLEAGVEHRPPRGNHARVIAALGAGSALGLMSSKAFAWVSTGTGKVTLAGMGLAVAGALYGVTSEPPRQLDAGPAPVAVEAPSSVVVADAVVEPAPPVPTKRFELLPPPSVSEPALPAEPEPALPAEPEPAAPRADDKARGRPRLAPPPSPQLENSPPSPSPPGLDVEVQWVDAMRAAVRRGDRAELESLLERYRDTFPEGQLREEVADLAARL